MTEYSRSAKGEFVSTGAAQVINLPFQPDYVEFYNNSIYATPADSSVVNAHWSSDDAQGTAWCEIYNAMGVLVTDSVATSGISTFAAGTLLQYGPVFNYTSNSFAINKASAAQITTSSAHGLASGDVVIFQNLNQTSTTGMDQIAGIPFTITVTAPTTFTIPWNTNQSSYTAFNTSTSTGNVGSFKQVLYPYLYQPGVAYINAITTGATTTITTTTANNFVAGQEVAFRIPSAYGTTQLNSLPDAQNPGSPIYGYVQSVTNAYTFVVNINSTGYTAFATNQAFASMVGQTFPQVVAVGDVNTGGWQYSGGNLYPSPLVNGVPTINGPAIQGAFVNNTSQGFIIGNGTCVTDTSAVLVGANTNVISWKAYLHDISQ